MSSDASSSQSRPQTLPTPFDERRDICLHISLFHNLSALEAAVSTSTATNKGVLLAIQLITSNLLYCSEPSGESRATFVLAMSPPHSRPVGLTATLHSVAVSALARKELAAILSALMAGAKYGVKIRLPHAIVMTALFGRRKGVTVGMHLTRIGRVVADHASHLACFAATYKSLLMILKWTSRRILQKYRSSAQQSTLSWSLWKRVGMLLAKALLMLGTRLESGCIDHLSLPCLALPCLAYSDTVHLLDLYICFSHWYYSLSGIIAVNGPHSVPSLSSPVLGPISPPTPPGYPERIYHSWIAGAIGGYFVWGRHSAVNHQILLYLSSRVLSKY
jgi:hypothetical protein